MSKKIEAEINLKKGVEFILNQLYFSEFEVLDGLSQHRDGYNFYDWLFMNKLIPEGNYKSICEMLIKESREEIKKEVNDG